MSLQHILKNSAVSGKEPTASQLANGEIALNYHADGPFLTCKDTGGAIRRITGVWINTTPPSTPTPSEFWLDISVTPAQLKIYKDSTDTWVSATTVYAASTVQAGIVELATDAETITGADALRAVTPASLQAKLSDSTGLANSARIASSAAVKSAYDLADAALPRTGGTITGAVQFALGAAATPSITFTGDTNTGLFSPSADQLSVTTGGTERLRIDAAGQIEAVSLGTATAPAWSFVSDPNTGLYSPGADQLALSTGGAGRIFIDSTGRLGVGTSSPVAGYATTTVGSSAWITNGANFTVEPDAASGTNGVDLKVSFTAGGNGPLKFWTGGVERLRIDSAGRVGIGTSSPGAPIEVAAANSAGASTVARLRHDNGADQHYFDITVNADTDTVKLISSGSTNGSIILGTAAVDTLVTTNSGNVGIGTSSPTFVSGGGLVIYKVGDARITLKNNTTGDGSATGAGLVYSGVNLTVNNQEAGFTAFTTTGTERLRIDSSGRVGIGTSSPGAILHTVNTSAGAATIGAFIQNSSITAGTEVRLGFAPNTNVVSDNRYSWIGAVNTGGSNDSSLTFATTPGGAPATERLRIDGSGRVGIGTSSPGTQLHVDTITDATAITVAASTSTVGQLLLGVGVKTGGYQGIIATGNGLDIGTTLGAPVIFYTNNTERLRIDSSGNVGIGTSSPGSPLDVAGEIRIYPASGDANLRFGSGGVEKGRIAVNSSSNLIIETAGTERARIDSSGNVGIGTSSPAQNLDVAGVIRGGDASATSGALILEGLYSGSDVINTFGSQHSSAATVIGYGVRPRNGTTGYTSTTGIASLFRGALEVGGADVALRVLYAGASTTPIGNVITMSEAMRIDSAGRVGIGTTSPNSKLEVSNASVDNFIRVNTTGANKSGIEFANGSAVYSQLYFNNTPPYDLSLLEQVGTGSLILGTNNTERLRIDSSGNVGIGTTSPGAASHVVSTNAGGVSIGTYLQNRSLTAGTEVRIAFGPNTNLVSDNRYSYIAAVNQTGSTDSFFTFATNPGGAAAVERMRIGTAGNINAFATSIDGLNSRVSVAAGTTTHCFAALHSATNVTDGTVSFRVFSNGDVVNTNNSYGAISDIKLKENIVDANSQWDDIKALQVRNYNFKEGQTHTQIGLVAQEAELVSPGLVYETPDRDSEGNDLGTFTKSINYSVLYMKAVKALQEAMERIETLEAKVAALEAA